MADKDYSLVAQDPVEFSGAIVDSIEDYLHDRHIYFLSDTVIDQWSYNDRPIYPADIYDCPFLVGKLYDMIANPICEAVLQNKMPEDIVHCAMAGFQDVMKECKHYLSAYDVAAIRKDIQQIVNQWIPEIDNNKSKTNDNVCGR